MANNIQAFERETITLPPEDYAFLSGMMTALTAMYCRLHPIPAQPAPDEAETRKEETNNDNS